MKDSSLPNRKPSAPITRRGFLAASALAAPMILSSGVFGVDGRPGANARKTVGIIGIGGKGKHHLQQVPAEVVALCDVDSQHLQEGILFLYYKN